LTPDIADGKSTFRSNILDFGFTSPGGNNKDRFYKAYVNALNQDKSKSSDVHSIIGLALDRKQISKNYEYSHYPNFMRSHHPFKIHNHAETKGKFFVENLHKAHL
jgi:hypothetical protein